MYIILIIYKLNKKYKTNYFILNILYYKLYN